MTRTRRTAGLALTIALLLGACTDGAPEVTDDLAASPSQEGPAPSPDASPAATTEPSAEPSPEPSPEPCPAGEQRLVPGGDCFEPSPAAAPEPSPESEPEPEPAPEPEPEPANPCDGRDQRDITVTAVNFSFSTDSIGDVCSGDTITLVIEEGSHSFTSSGAGADTGVFSESEGSRTATVSAGPGTYNYVCSLHGQMNGELTVIG